MGAWAGRWQEKLSVRGEGLKGSGAGAGVLAGRREPGRTGEGCVALGEA